MRPGFSELRCSVERLMEEENCYLQLESRRECSAVDGVVATSPLLESKYDKLLVVVVIYACLWQSSDISVMCHK